MIPWWWVIVVIIADNTIAKPIQKLGHWSGDMLIVGVRSWRTARKRKQLQNKWRSM